MTTSRRRVLAASAVPAILLLAAGCSAPAETAAPVKTNTAATECAIEDVATLGLGAPLEIATDEAGTYCHLTADLEKVSYPAYADVKVGKWAADSGITWSDDEPGLTEGAVLDAQKLTARWVVEEFLDGAAVDQSAEHYREWIETTALIGEEWRSDYLAGWDSDASTGGLTVSRFDQPLVRDSRPRVTGVALSPRSTSVFEVEGKQYVETCFAVGATHHGADGTTYELDAPSTCATFRASDTEVPYVLEGTHGRFTVKTDDGTIIAEQDES